MPDQTILCSDCHHPFTFTDKEATFYNSKGFQPPKRCKACRERKRQERGGESRSEQVTVKFPIEEERRRRR